VTGDEWAVAESKANGSPVICGGLVEEERGSESVDGFWTLKTTLVDDCFLRFPSMGGGLRGSWVYEDAVG